MSSENSVRQIRTLLVAGETLLRSALARAIVQNDRFRLLADFDELEPVLDCARRDELELVVLDVQRASEEILCFLQRLRARSDAAVLAVSVTDYPGFLLSLREAGVRGFIWRNESIEVLEEAMVEVGEGRTYFPATFFQLTASLATAATPLQTLSNREVEILRRIAAGQTSRAIASHLQLSFRSIETYRSRMMRKLKAPNSAAMIQLALRAGVLNSQVA